MAALALVFFCASGTAQETQAAAPSSAYQDLTHFSKVFGRDKFFRLYLPRGYDQSDRRYPVIYFFHGWGGRHFKDDNAKIEYENIKALVDTFQVLLVMWDGNIEENEPRPYNVGNHEDVKYQIQMADYFPELVAHIDSHFRTLTDRNHRGIIGFSMGGFMALFLAGKYPQDIGAVVSIAGSPEFFLGWPDNHTLYPVRYAFQNLQGVHLRMHNGDSDILFYLNKEVHEGASWQGIPIDYWQFHGPHMIDYPGETRVFQMAMSSIIDGFRNPMPPPRGWTHHDLYPDFSVWGYHVETNKREPGFITLGNVDRDGFRVASHRWLPDGPPLANIHGNLTTPPIYDPLSPYSISRCDGDRTTLETIVSDSLGRISIDFSGAASNIGVSHDHDSPSFAFAGYTIGKSGRYLRIVGSNPLNVHLFNRGGKSGLPSVITATISSSDPAIGLTESRVTLSVDPENRLVALPPISVACSKAPPPHAEPPEIRFVVTITINGTSSKDEFTVPVLYQAPSFDTLRIDDGVAVRDTAFGTGNGDGIADAGERLMFYQNTHRLRLYPEDPWIVPGDERLADEMIPARWPDGYTLSSIIHIDPACPDGHHVECLASYETKTFNPIERNVTWGYVHFIVRHK